MLGCVLAPLPIFAVYITEPYCYEYKTLLKIALPLSIILGVIMVGFNWWSWYLCFIGYSTIEFMRFYLNKFNVQTLPSLEGIKLSNMKENILKTFGTSSLLLMLFPSIRDLPFLGHEWTLEVIELESELQKHDTNSIIK